MIMMVVVGCAVLAAPREGGALALASHRFITLLTT